jgi:mannose-6-phosphate isomerase-like protein (cupin superfamily)
MKGMLLMVSMMGVVMLACDQPRKSDQVQTASGAATAGSDHSNYVRRLNEGEMLAGVNFQFTPKDGATRLWAATWSPPRGTKIPLHKHTDMEEYFFIHSGRGILVINEDSIPIETGMSLFVPKDTWHGFAFPDQAAVIFGVTSPPGLEEVFRAWSTPGLSKEQISALERKHGMQWRQAN